MSRATLVRGVRRQSLVIKVSFTAPWNGGTIHVEADTVAELSKLVQDLRRTLGSEMRPPFRSPSGRAVEQADEYPQIPEALGCADAIRKLLLTNWGSVEARTEAELTSALRANALHYGHGTISGLLTYLTRRGELRRLKKGRSYAYVASRSPERNSQIRSPVKDDEDGHQGQPK